MSDTPKSSASMFDEMVSNPYFFRPLWERRRKIILYVGRSEERYIPASTLFAFTRDHDDLRTLAAWGMIVPVSESELREYEVGIVVNDWDIVYRAGTVAREFARLELNNFAQLQRGILLILRCTTGAFTRAGPLMLAVSRMTFHELVVMTNRPEESVYVALQKLSEMKLINANLELDSSGKLSDRHSTITLTNEGLLYLEKGTSMTYNHIEVSNSTLGVIAVQSQLRNIDVSIGALKQQGNADIAARLKELSEAIAQASLDDGTRKDSLEQVEAIAAEAEKAQDKRKGSVIKGAGAFLEKVLANAANTATVWSIAWPVIKGYFGI